MLFCGEDSSAGDSFHGYQEVSDEQPSGAASIICGKVLWVDLWDYLKRSFYKIRVP